MSKQDFIKRIALEFKIRSGASFVLSNRQKKKLRKWIRRQNKKLNLLSINEEQLVLINLMVKS